MRNRGSSVVCCLAGRRRRTFEKGEMGGLFNSPNSLKRVSAVARTSVDRLPGGSDSGRGIVKKRRTRQYLLLC